MCHIQGKIKSRNKVNSNKMMSIHFQFGNKIKIVICLLCLLMVLASYYVFTPTNDSVTIRYLAQDISVPQVIQNVKRIEEYYLYDELYQVVIWQENSLVPVVFTPFDYISHRTAVFSSIQTVKFFDEVYHTYDNVLQGLKYKLRKNFVMEKYQELFGREPTKEELCWEMDKLIQKVQFEQLEVRLSHYPEAVFYSIAQLRNSKPNGVETTLIRILLWLGIEPEQIVGLFG